MILLQDFDKVNEMQRAGIAEQVATLFMPQLSEDEFAELWQRVKASRLAGIMTDYLGAKVEIGRAEIGPFLTVTMPTAESIVFTRDEFMRKYGHLMG